VSVPGRVANPLAPGWHNLLTGGHRQDALWYLRIATGGYRPDDGSAAFFPLYPVAIRVLAAVPGLGPLAAATVLAQGSFLGSLVVLRALAAREYGDQVGQRAMVLMAVFPTAFFFLAPYTESPFLLLVLLSFWYARRDRFGAAAVPALLAGLTRSAGVLLVAALAVEALAQARGDAGPGRARRLAGRLAASLAPAVGLASYLLFWAARGDVAAPLDAQRNWQREGDFPLTTLVDAARAAWRYQSFWLVDLLVVGVAVAALVAGVRLLRPSYLTYGALSLLLPLCEPFPPRPLMSAPRFALVVFPVFVVLAVAVQRRRLSERLVLGFSVGGYVLLGLLFLTWRPIF